MNTTKLLIGTALGAVANFMGGWLIYGMLLMNAMAAVSVAGTQKAEPNMLGIFASCAVAAFLMAFIFDRWAGIKTLKSGAIAGAIISGLMALSVDLSLFSMANWFTDFSGVVMDVVAAAVLGALTGAAIGWYYGYNEKA